MRNIPLPTLLRRKYKAYIYRQVKGCGEQWYTVIHLPRLYSNIVPSLTRLFPRVGEPVVGLRETEKRKVACSVLVCSVYKHGTA